MPLKPIDKRTAVDTRQAVWEAIRGFGEFTVRQLREETVLKLDSVREYVIGLENGGYIERIPGEDTRFSAHRWKLVNDIGHEAPRVRRDGTPVTQGQGRENMWNAMRIMRMFNARELAVAARTPGCFVKESTAADYCRYLWRAGYLTRLENGSYRMLPTAYTGPRAPMVQRSKAVWDPNQNTIRWKSGEGEVDHDQ